MVAYIHTKQTKKMKKEKLNYLTTSLRQGRHFFYCIICTYATQYIVSDTKFFPQKFTFT